MKKILFLISFIIYSTSGLMSQQSLVNEDQILVICDTDITPTGVVADSILICGNSSNGVTSITANCAEYSPNTNYFGVDTVCLSYCLAGVCTDTNIAILVIQVDEPFYVNEDEILTVCDIDFTPLGVAADSIQICLPASNGTSTIVGNCIDYEPNPNFFGYDSICLSYCIAGNCTDTLIQIIINPVGDSLYVTSPEDIASSVCENIISGNSDVIISSCSTPLFGNAVYSPSCVDYTPNLNFVGLDSFCIVSCVDTLCDTSSLIIDMTPVTETLNITVPGNQTIQVCYPNFLTTVDAVTQFTMTNPPTNGTIVVNSNTNCILYAPNATFAGSGLAGTDNFTITICNSDGVCDITNVNITITSFTVTQLSIADSLAKALGGPGVTITNATLNCALGSSGLYSNPPNGLGIGDGVLLSTGDAIDVAGPTAGTVTGNQGTPGDPALDAIFASIPLPYTTNDACVLEFDIEVTGDSLKFNYVFGSEEYQSFVCNGYNDLFAFFISGPNPAGGNYVAENVAIVPGSNPPEFVAINTVNDGTPNGNDPGCNAGNTAFYNGPVPGVIFEGNTVKLQALAATVPCQTYSFRLVIADGGDTSFDSGVFLEAGSFSSNAVIIGASSVLGEGFDDAVEGCVDGVFSLKLDSPYTVPVMIGYNVSGTATNGVDYAFIADSVLVPAGDTVVDIPLNVFVDGIAEGIETVILTPYTACGTLGDPTTLHIVDDFEHSITPSSNFLCTPAVVSLTATGAQFYSWSDAALLTHPDSSVTSTLTPLTETTTFYMEGELGTCNFTDTFTVFVNDAIPTFFTSPISCPGANDGAIWVEWNDSATGPFTYSHIFFPGITDSIVTTVGPGFQLMTANVAFGPNGCSNTFTTTFATPTSTVFDFDTVGISCAGANDGSICIYNIVNGTYTASVDTNGVLFGNYSFTINSDTFCIPNLGPNNYEVNFINDTTTCDATFTTSLSEPDGLAYSYFIEDALCNNSDDGAICIFNIANGNYSLDLSFNGAAATTSTFTINSDTFCISNLAFGVYEVNLSNLATGCNATFIDSIAKPDSLGVAINVMGTGLCAGGSIDSLVSITTGGTGTYDYAWNTGATTPNIYSVAFATYTLVVTDNNNCQDSASVTLVAPTPIFFSLAQDSVLCFGANTGSAFVDSISGGNAPYTYAWSDGAGQTTDSAINLIADQYILTVLDLNNCSAIDSITVLQPADSMTITLSAEQISCFGADTCIEATITGGNAPYTFLWNTAETTEDICNATAGNYSIIVTDANGCMQTQSITVTEVPEIVLTKDSVNIDCFGADNGVATVTATGGSGAFTYLWNDALAQTTASATNLAPGNYTVIVADANDTNCTQTISINITQPTGGVSLALDKIQDVQCFDGATGIVAVNLSGGTLPYTLNWNTTPVLTNDTAFNLLAGQYILTVVDANGCQAIDSSTVLQPADSMTITLSAEQISCFGADTCIEATITGGNAPYTFLWNTAETTEDICNATAGNYSIIVTDANGCMQTQSITVTEVPEIVLTKDSVNIDCFGAENGVATVTATGGSGAFTYLWNDALAQTTASATNLAPGNYTVIVADVNDNNCTQTISINITQPADSLSVALANLQDVICFGAATGAIDVNINGGTAPYDYNWTNGTTNEDINGVVANTYTLIITDNNNCTETYTDIITQPTALTLNLVSNSPVSCFDGNDGSLDIAVSGGVTPYNYAWSNGAITEDVSNLTAGTYMLTVTDFNNCPIVGNYTVIQPSDVSISFQYSNYSGSNVSCFGNTDGTLEAVVAGGTAPYTYAWDNGTNANPATNLAAGIVNVVTVTDASGCEYTQAANALTTPDALSIAKDSTNLTCAGYSDGTATAIPTGGSAPYLFLWTDPAAQNTATASNLASGVYNCNITDANGCTEIIQVEIEEPLPIVVLTTMDSVRCWGDADGVITITATGGNGNAFEYSIDGGTNFQAGNIFSELTAGIYSSIIVRQGGINGCLSAMISETVLQPEPMFISINPEDTTVQLQEAAPLQIIVDPATGYYSGTSYSSADISSVTWSPTSGLDCTDCLNPNSLVFNDTEYTASVLYSPYGCETSASATVFVENNLRFFIPNSFSPQADGINDTHLVYGEGLKDFSIAIFNRIGEKVFQSNNQSIGWDGTYKGVMQNPGVYTYIFYATYLDDKEISLQGSITLLR